jgi:cell wall-associated NlpC family hydrolase
MKKITLQLLALSSIIALSSCSTLNPMMSYVQASVKTSSHKANKKQKTTKDPHITFTPTPLHLRAKFSELPLTNTISTVPITIATSVTPIDILHNLYLAKATFEDTIASVRQELGEFAKQFIGVRYRSRGKSAKGFDCSGFTSYVMANSGYNLTSSSVRQAEIGETIDISEARKGDLVFFGHKNKKGGYRVNHAAMVISEPGEPFAMIHASRRGIVIDDINSSSWRNYYSKKFIHVKRVLHLEELIVKR